MKERGESEFNADHSNELELIKLSSSQNGTPRHRPHPIVRHRSHASVRHRWTFREHFHADARSLHRQQLED